MTTIEQEDAMSVEIVSFTALDRCDRCGSQALAVARKSRSRRPAFLQPPQRQA